MNVATFAAVSGSVTTWTPITCSAWDLDRDDWRTFRVDRIEPRVVVHAPAAHVRSRLPAPVEVEPLGEDRCAFEAGSDHPEMLALHLGVLGADFTVDSPELLRALAELTQRYQRAIDAGSGEGRAR
jgi:predicted DNA-binding transcriptional regulator YafY